MIADCGGLSLGRVCISRLMQTGRSGSMELPPLLRQAVDRALNGARAGRPGQIGCGTFVALSRGTPRRCALHVGSRRDALAYLAVRLPADLCGGAGKLRGCGRCRPDFAPKTRARHRRRARALRSGPRPIAGPASPMRC